MFESVFVLIMCAIIAISLYVRQCINHWKDRGVKHFFLDASVQTALGRRSLVESYEEIYRNAAPNEPYIGIFTLLKPVLFIRDPHLIHEITTTRFNHFHERNKLPGAGGRLNLSLGFLQGEEWKLTRNKLVTTFSAAKMRKMYELMDECTELLVEHHLRPSAKAGNPVDVNEIMARYSLDVTGQCAFGLRFNTLTESDSLYQEVAKSLLDTGFKNRCRKLIQFLNPKLFGLFGLKVTSDEAEKFFLNLLRGAEKLRRTESERRRQDILQIMLSIKDEQTNKLNYLFTEDHIASNIYMFYLAGHESTSSTMAFALYELALNPEMQDRLRRDIAKAREDNNGVLDYDAVTNIAYLEMVISETLRIHGPGTFITRTCTESCRVSGMPFELRAGEQIIYSITGVHKDEKYFPNPRKFDPERFSAENIAQMHPHAYLPFGKGPRICFGLRFAKLEMKIGLVAVISRFKFSVCDKTEVPVALKKGSLFYAAQNGVWLSVNEI